MKNSVLMFTLKNKALQLRKDYQLPFYLTKCIYGLKKDDNVHYIETLMFLVEQLMRVKGFYKKYSDQDKSSKDVVIEVLTKRGFLKNDSDTSVCVNR